jgi:Ca2+-binding EF-hand superfamily protein
MDQKILLSKTRMERAFKMFDRDNNGKISSNELYEVRFHFLKVYLKEGLFTTSDIFISWI